MIHNIKRFWNDDSGPELVEWAVVTIILLVAAVVLYVAVGNALGAVICAVKCWLLAVVQDTRDGITADCFDNTDNNCDSTN
jgi:hypothetical protein